MSFNLSYVVNPIDVKSLPPHLFTSKKTQFIKGMIVNIPEVTEPLEGTETNFGTEYAEWQKTESVFIPEFDCELTGISIAASEYAAPDCWQLEIDGHRILETIYLKEIAEEFVFDVVIPVTAGSEVKFTYYNGSETQKIIWYNLKFVR